GRGLRSRRSGELLVDDLLAERDALIADEDGSRTGDELSDLILALAAERAPIVGHRAYLQRTSMFSAHVRNGSRRSLRRPQSWPSRAFAKTPTRVRCELRRSSEA